VQMLIKDQQRLSYFYQPKIQGEVKHDT